MFSDQIKEEFKDLLLSMSDEVKTSKDKQLLGSLTQTMKVYFRDVNYSKELTEIVKGAKKVPQANPAEGMTPVKKSRFKRGSLTAEAFLKPKASQSTKVAAGDAGKKERSNPYKSMLALSKEEVVEKFGNDIPTAVEFLNNIRVLTGDKPMSPSIPNFGLFYKAFIKTVNKRFLMTDEQLAEARKKLADADPDETGDE